MNSDLCVGFSKTKWEALSQQLDGNENAWSEAIGVFERRMRERFFSSIDALFAADTKPDKSSGCKTYPQDCIPGFSIMALCCLLIETLQSFQEVPSAGTNQQFMKFLSRPAFGGAFNRKIAKSFVTGIRNGILHEAETRKWVIWRDEPEDKIAAPEEDGFALNRSLFYAALKSEFESYLRELRDPTNSNLRNRFKKKMDDLCGEA
jgi:hypothetical protein